MHPEVEVVERGDGAISVEALFRPLPEHRGRQGWLHGGLAATVLDHVCARAAATALGQTVVTGRLDLRYRRPVLLADGPYRVVAVAEGSGGRTVRVEGALCDRDGDRRLVEARSLFVALQPESSGHTGAVTPSVR